MFDLVRLPVFSQMPKGIRKLYSIPSLPPSLFLQTDSPSKIISKKAKIIYYLTSFEPSMGAIKSVAEGKGAFAIPILPLLNVSGIQKAVLLSKMRNFVRICKKYNADFFPCTLAQSQIELRNARELIGFGELLDLSENESREKMKTLKRIIE